MNDLVTLLLVAIVFWGFIMVYLFYITMRLQRIEKELSMIRTKTGKDISQVVQNSQDD